MIAKLVSSQVAEEEEEEAVGWGGGGGMTRIKKTTDNQCFIFVLKFCSRTCFYVSMFLNVFCFLTKAFCIFVFQFYILFAKMIS